MSTTWKKRAVIYQIYPRSFLDSNGDGIGDLNGIRSKLDYLKELGVDILWLSPIYKSPNDDNGYDIADYRAIMDEFGTMADFDRLLAEAHARGLRIVMDLVVNHTSDEHAWFQDACRSKDSPYRDYYIWRRPGADGAPPNNWEAAFSGSAWQFHAPTGEYYLHMFSKKQPDLNWENPKVRAEVYDLMRFWLDKGIDGFRMDVINMISKPYAVDGSLPDAPVIRDGFLQPGFALVTNGPRLLEFLGEMKRQVLSHYDIITVGETPATDIAQGVALTDSDTGVLDMIFHFEHMDLDTVPGQADGKWAVRPVPLGELKAVMTRWQHGLHGRGNNALYLSNHDQPRPVSRFGDDSRWRERSAKMLATCLHGLEGTPYVYQGEELGMTNTPFASIDDCRDIEAINWYAEVVAAGRHTPAEALAAIRAKGRDNARTPVQWTAAASAGFTTGTPWIGVNPNFVTVNAEAAIADPASVFHYYRRLIALRKQEAILTEGDYRLLAEGHPDLYAYLRTLGSERWLVVCNFSDGQPVFTLADDIVASGAELIIANTDDATADDFRLFTLRPYEARIFRLV